MNRENDEIEIDLLDLLRSLLSHIRVILLCTVLGGLIAGLYTSFMITPLYQSTAKIYILSNSITNISISDLQLGSGLAKDYEELIVSRTVARRVIENLGLEESVDSLISRVSVQNKDNTRIISITVTYPDPMMAQQLANEFAAVSKSRMEEVTQQKKPTDVDEAEVPVAKSSPNNRRNILLGLVVGFILASGLFTVNYILDDTVKSAEDIEHYLNLNTLVSIPLEGGTDNSEKKSGKKRRRVRGIRRQS